MKLVKKCTRCTYRVNISDSKQIRICPDCGSKLKYTFLPEKNSGQANKNELEKNIENKKYYTIGLILFSSMSLVLFIWGLNGLVDGHIIMSYKSSRTHFFGNSVYFVAIAHFLWSISFALFTFAIYLTNGHVGTHVLLRYIIGIFVAGLVFLAIGGFIK